MSSILLVILGLTILLGGGELLVRGAVKVATRLGVSPLLISLTLVGFGTSAPELVISIQASLYGSAGIALGNIVGSNIANVLLILGLASLIAPIAVPSATLKRDGSFVLAASIGFAAIVFVLPLGRMAGTMLVLSLAAYAVHIFRCGRGNGQSDGSAAIDGSATASVGDSAVERVRPRKGHLLGDLVIGLTGLSMVIFGANVLVDGAVSLARGFGISETLIGLTVVAVGTAMPEIITCALAAYRGHSEIVFGTVVGSNLSNILGIGGLTGLIAPTEVPHEITTFDNPVMVGVTALMVLFARTGRRIGRSEGSMLLVGYVAYTWILWAEV